MENDEEDDKIPPFAYKIKPTISWGKTPFFYDELKNKLQEIDFKTATVEERHKAYQGLIPSLKVNDLEKAIEHFASFGDESRKLTKDLIRRNYEKMEKNPYKETEEIAEKKARLLMLAAKYGDKEFLDEKIFNKNDKLLSGVLSDRNQHGESLLHYACQSDNLELVFKIAQAYEKNGNEDPFNMSNDKRSYLKTRPIHYMSESMAEQLDRALGTNGAYSKRVRYYQDINKVVVHSTYQHVKNIFSRDENFSQFTVFSGKGIGGGTVGVTGMGGMSIKSMASSTGIISASVAATSMLAFGVGPAIIRQIHKKRHGYTIINGVAGEKLPLGNVENKVNKDQEKIIELQGLRKELYSDKKIKALLNVTYFPDESQKNEIFLKMATKTSAKNLERIVNHLTSDGERTSTDNKDIVKNILGEVIDNAKEKDPQNIAKLTKAALLSAESGDEKLLVSALEGLKDQGISKIEEIKDRHGNNLLHYAIASANVETIRIAESALKQSVGEKQDIYELKNNHHMPVKKMLAGNLELAQKLGEVYTDYANDHKRREQNYYKRIGYKAMAYTTGAVASSVVVAGTTAVMGVGIPAAAIIGSHIIPVIGTFAAAAAADMGISKLSEMVLNKAIKYSYSHFMDRAEGYNKNVVTNIKFNNKLKELTKEEKLEEKKNIELSKIDPVIESKHFWQLGNRFNNLYLETQAIIINYRYGESSNKLSKVGIDINNNPIGSLEEQQTSAKVIPSSYDPDLKKWLEKNNEPHDSNGKKEHIIIDHCEDDKAAIGNEKDKVNEVNTRAKKIQESLANISLELPSFRPVTRKVSGLKGIPISR